MKKSTLKDLPSVNQVLISLNGSLEIHDKYLKFLINEEISLYRCEIKKGQLSKRPQELLNLIIEKVKLKSSHSLVNLINGTGIVLHTGFGRAPFQSEFLKKIASRMEGYVNLEFDLYSGKRGDRQLHIQNHRKILHCLKYHSYENQHLIEKLYF